MIYEVKDQMLSLTSVVRQITDDLIAADVLSELEKN